MGDEGFAGLPQVSPCFGLGRLSVLQSRVGAEGWRTMPSAHLASSCFNELLRQSTARTNLVSVSKRIKLWLVTLMVCLADGEVAVSLQR